MKIKKILFPTDYSIYSDRAREYALQLAEVLKSRVYLLHAIEPLEYTDVDEEIKTFYSEIKIQLKEKMEKERAYFDYKDIDTHIAFVVGSSWKVINTYAKEKEIDLIIIGSHGIKTEKGDISIGTTSHKVMLTSPCPVLVIRNDYSVVNV